MRQPSANNGHLLPSPGLFAKCFPHALKLLLVGIDDADLAIIRTELPSSHYRLYACSIGAVAADLALRTPNFFDLVISNVSLPDMDGFLFIRDQLSSTNIPHIVICGVESSSQIVTAYRSGACYVLCKPLVKVDELRNLWLHVCWRRSA